MEDYTSRRVIAICETDLVGSIELMCPSTLLLNRHGPLEHRAPWLHTLGLVTIPEDSGRKQSQPLSSSIGAEKLVLSSQWIVCRRVRVTKSPAHQTHRRSIGRAAQYTL